MNKKMPYNATQSLSIHGTTQMSHRCKGARASDKCARACSQSQSQSFLYIECISPLTLTTRLKAEILINKWVLKWLVLIALLV